MYRTIQYSILLVVLVMLQALLFDNLVLVPFVFPMVYIAFVVLLPVRSSWLVQTVLGFAIGALVDFSMGTAGINTIATTFIGFVRPWVMNLTMGQDVQYELIPYGGNIERKEFLLYAVILVLLHNTLFFAFESLGSHLPATVLKIVCSTVINLLLVWLTAALFAATEK
ncbi:MAG: rod shape-determining protein MreD [Tidjanibacter sp.]|nr:rod shape-determining protein MreD [Tidjanibacter sp.]